jgi:hypothetical protein
MIAAPRKPFWNRKRWIAAAVLWLVLVAPSASFLAFVVWSENRPAIPRSQAARLHVGMTDAEVRSLIGIPQGIYPVRGGGQQWVFRRGTISRYFIEFAQDGRLVSHWEDR